MDKNNIVGTRKKNNSKRLRFTKKFSSILVIAMTALTIFSMVSISGNAHAEEVKLENIAGSTTRYYSYFNPVTAIPQYTYKDVYTSYNVTQLNNFDRTYAYVDSHCGPTDMTRKEWVKSGTKRTVSFSAQIPIDIVKVTAGCSTTISNEASLEKTFTFPGDNTNHTLYITRRHIDKDVYSKRTSYIAYPVSYNYIWGVVSWNVVWGSYSRYSSRDIANHKSASITEYQYGTYMN